MKKLLLCVVTLVAAPALAAPTVEVKAAKGVQKHEPVDPGDTFAVKDTVWVWTHVKDGSGTKIKHVWKRDGKEEWSTTLDIGGKDWVTNSRRVVKAGAYVVEVQAEDGTKLGEVAFTVK